MYNNLIPLFSTYTFMFCYRVRYQTIYCTVPQCLHSIDCRMELAFFFRSGMVVSHSQHSRCNCFPLVCMLDTHINSPLFQWKSLLQCWMTCWIQYVSKSVLDKSSDYTEWKCAVHTVSDTMGGLIITERMCWRQIPDTTKQLSLDLCHTGPYSIQGWHPIQMFMQLPSYFCLNHMNCFKCPEGCFHALPVCVYIKRTSLHGTLLCLIHIFIRANAYIWVHHFGIMHGVKR